MLPGVLGVQMRIETETCDPDRHQGQGQPGSWVDGKDGAEASHWGDLSSPGLWALPRVEAPLLAGGGGQV